MNRQMKGPQDHAPQGYRLLVQVAADDLGKEPIRLRLERTFGPHKAAAVILKRGMYRMPRKDYRRGTERNWQWDKDGGWMAFIPMTPEWKEYNR